MAELPSSESEAQLLLSSSQKYSSNSSHSPSQSANDQVGAHGAHELNLETHHLHEACERGDKDSVENIILCRKANVNGLIGGHRAYRTALHKAASYGHTDIVKLLLKAGASADKPSSVQRTALHEACMGGHKDALLELVQYAKDLDAVDNHGQTAAHIAAYHGEAECLSVLIKNGCNLDCEDKQMCTPAHLAVMKNHPETLRCLLDNNIDIAKADGQGRTPVHYAALYGSINCLKTFKEFHIDLTITDQIGCNPSHHASAGGHISCLRFLTKAGLPLDKTDRSGKTCAHYAAQKGSTECLHWILEQGLDASIADDFGNTPAHFASSGHMEAINCLLLHNSNMLLTNNMGDTPDELSRKYGHTVAYQKAVNGTIKCPFCVKKQKQLEYDLKHQPSEVEKNIRQEECVIFKSPIKTKNTTKKKPQQRSMSKPVAAHPSLSKRDLSTKFYGEHLFSLTSEQRTTFQETERNTKK